MQFNIKTKRICALHVANQPYGSWLGEILMAIIIHGNQFENCGVGISAPADANLEIGTNCFVACGKAIDLRSPSSLMEALGLSKDTPPVLLKEMLTFLSESPRDTEDVTIEAKRVGLFEWLSAGADVSTLVSTLISLCPHIPSILASLPK